MRLGQLARTLNTTTTEIVVYLSDQQITIKDHPNVKLDEEIEQQVINAFTTHAPVERPSDPTPANEASSVNEPAVESSLNKTSESQPQTPQPQASDSFEENGQQPEMNEAPAERSNEEAFSLSDTTEEVEVIRAPKIELQGLKVLGKIELPENNGKAAREKQEVRKDGKSKKIVRRKPLSEEEKEKRRIKSKKEKEKRERIALERQKEREKQKLKEKKKKHYLKKISKPAPAPTTKPDKKIKAKTTKQQQPKTLLGKFWRWLNT